MLMTEVATTHTRPNQAASQGTAIEQQRAIAEVQAAVVAARTNPRNVAQAVRDMEEACGQLALAQRAFFRFPRGREQVSGPSVHLARALAPIWQNLDYGIRELRRDDEGGESEMQAWAWDQQSNTRTTLGFIQPHAIDTKAGRRDLTDLRDIYESNANAGARRVRECIFAMMPSWFVERAKDLCAETLRTDGGSGKPLQARIADIIKAYSGLGVTENMLGHKAGRPPRDWTDLDVANLTVIGQSIRRGETTVAAEFPDVAGQAQAARTLAALAAQTAPAAQTPEPRQEEAPQPPAENMQPGTVGPATVNADAYVGTEAADGTGQAPEAPAETPQNAPTAQAPPPTPPADDEPDERVGVTRPQLTKISILANELGLNARGAAREEYLALLSDIACRPIQSATELTKVEASWVIEKWDAQVKAAPKPPADEPPTEPVYGDIVIDTDDPELALQWDRLRWGASNRQISEADLRATLARELGDGHQVTLRELQEYTTKMALATVKPVRTGKE
jgi:hypothetical protein